MAVASVYTVRVKPGRFQDTLSLNSEATKIIERHGAQLQVWRQAVGAEPAAIIYVIQHDDMTQYGAFSDKLQSDAEWQRLVERIQTDPDPPTEPISNSLLTEVP
jgi:hypothetical protein